MTRIWLLYIAAVLAAAAAGFFSPLWYLGFLPLSAGLLYAALDMVEVKRGDVPPAPRQ